MEQAPLIEQRNMVGVVPTDLGSDSRQYQRHTGAGATGRPAVRVNEYLAMAGAMETVLAITG